MNPGQYGDKEIEIGTKFGELTVIEKLSVGKYRCRCSCGVIRDFKRSMLLKGDYKSCGHVGKKLNDLTGMIFGELTVLRYLGDKKYSCKCSCGKELITTSYNLTHSIKISCGHEKELPGKIEDLRGKIFGHFEPIKYMGKSRWLCKCNCGAENCLKEKEVAAYSLISGATKSCGVSTTGFKDLTGKQIGEWKVLGYDSNKKWLCECSCGKKQVVNLNTLKSGRGNCGHDLDRGFINIKDQRFGKLVVLEYLGNNKWKCKCDCGNTLEVYGSNLRKSSGTRSCGCSTEEIRQTTMIDRYGDIAVSRISNPREEWQVRAILNSANLTNVINELQNKLGRSPTLTELSEYLDADKTRLAEKLSKYNLRELIDNSSGKSTAELLLANYINNLCKDYNYSIIRNSRKILLDGKELDIYIPDISLAFEYNGSFWHSSLFKSLDYHYNKSLECEKLKIRLIHIFDYEWNDNIQRDKLLKYIRNLLNNKKKIIYARDCKIKETSIEEAREFIEKYHLQGYANSRFNIGIYYNSELIGIMTFDIPRFNKEYEYELIRLCWKDNLIVVGGAEKLFKYFISKNNPQSIITYCDIAKFRGTVYSKLGFKLDSKTNPNYKWYNTAENLLLSRYSTMKHKLIVNGWGTEEETEDAIMYNHKYYKIYDCGNLRYIWNKD